VRVGDKIAYARIGAELLDGHSGERVKLKAAKIRGVVSNGMACSEKELGISDSHQGLLILPADAPIGKPLAEYLGDAIFNLEVTPNRPDCLSVIGIAHEVAALTGQVVHLPEVSYPEAGAPIGDQVTVEIVAPDLCPRYCATLIKGVRIGESPAWMQRRLTAAGARPINNIVDVTNYVMLEHGQPLHSFDFAEIRGKKIIVRRAKPGEIIYTLDAVERRLTPSMLVIADEQRAVAVAGVMGGANTEVVDGTSTILLEAANFNAANIHYTSRTLGLPSEASQRFERGIRADVAVPALRRATQLIVQLAGGEAAPGMVDAYPGKRPPETIKLSITQFKRVLGVGFGRQQATQALTSLGFEVRSGSETEVEATPPYWRSDIHLPVDLIEEVARVIGYDAIPTTLISQPIPKTAPLPVLRVRREIREALTGLGFQEIATPTLMGQDALRKLAPEGQTAASEPLSLLNPTTADQACPRPTLRANVLAALAVNLKLEEGGIRLFEVGKVFLPRGNDLPEEREVLCGVICGPAQPRWWQGGGEAADFFVAKGVAESVLARLNVAADFAAGDDASLHPATQAAILGGQRFGVVGEVHPKVREAFEITAPAYLFEIELPAVMAVVPPQRTYEPIGRFPAMVRDIAIVVGTDVTHRSVLGILKGFPLVKHVALFDVYSGEQVPPGKKSLAYRITYQSPAKTLTDEAVNQVQGQILQRLAKELGATLRS
jgi:phenylalanyl-tRNA synthetase beta chain